MHLNRMGTFWCIDKIIVCTAGGVVPTNCQDTGPVSTALTFYCTGPVRFVRLISKGTWDSAKKQTTRNKMKHKPFHSNSVSLSSSIYNKKYKIINDDMTGSC